MLKNSSQIPLGANITKPGSSKEYKTGGWKTFAPIWDQKKCTQCLICPINCPENCIPIKDGKRIETELDFCKGCGICAQVCPFKAIHMKKCS